MEKFIMKQELTQSYIEQGVINSQKHQSEFPNKFSIEYDGKESEAYLQRNGTIKFNKLKEMYLIEGDVIELYEIKPKEIYKIKCNSLSKYDEYSYKDAIGLLQQEAPHILEEIQTIIGNIKPYQHGKSEGETIKENISPRFEDKGWEKEWQVPFGTDKKDRIDFHKNDVAIEMEFSNSVVFFRDFFRFMILHKKRAIKIGVIITYSERAFKLWPGKVNSQEGIRASLKILKDLLEGDYKTIVDVPIWCIGIH